MGKSESHCFPFFPFDLCPDGFPFLSDVRASRFNPSFLKIRKKAYVELSGTDFSL